MAFVVQRGPKLAVELVLRRCFRKSNGWLHEFGVEGPCCRLGTASRQLVTHGTRSMQTVVQSSEDHIISWVGRIRSQGDKGTIMFAVVFDGTIAFFRQLTMV